MGRLENETTVVRVGIVQALLRLAEDVKPANPDPDDLDSETYTCQLGIKEDNYQDSRDEQDIVVPLHARACECAQVHIIYRIYREVGDEVGVGTESRSLIGEIEPVVNVKHRGGDVKQEDGPFDARLVIAAEQTDGEEDGPEETHHHRQRNNPVV